MRLHFVRHGESTANLLGVFSNGSGEHPLTEKGVEQARTLARDLSVLQVSRINTSPVLRAVQTARILSESLDAPLEISEALREWSVGVYEGTTDPAGWELHRRVQEDWFVHNRPDSRMPGGESFLEIRERFVPFIDGLIQADGPSDRTVVLVGHEGLYLAMLPIILKNVGYPQASRRGFPSGSCVIAETRTDGLHCLSWCGESVEG
jgi:broad specificity phosphatase PhoE